MGIQMGSGWAKAIRKFGSTNVAEVIDQSLIRQAMQKGVMVAREQIDTLVYDAPLPASAGPGYERTGSTRRAIRKGNIPKIEGIVGKVQGEIMVDENMVYNPRSGYFYPYILNRGRTDINYSPRPFWKNMKEIMQDWFKSQGRRALIQIRDLYKP